MKAKPPPGHNLPKFTIGDDEDKSDDLPDVNQWPRVISMLKAVCAQLEKNPKPWAGLYRHEPSFPCLHDDGSPTAASASDCSHHDPDPFATLGSTSLLRMIYVRTPRGENDEEITRRSAARWALSS